MERTHCSVDAKHIRHFLNACKGNWHNCIYVDCSLCSTKASCRISDFLFHPDKDAVPCILPLADADILFAEIPDSAECLSAWNIRQFFTLYKAYLDNFDHPTCPCIQLLRNQEEANYDW